MVLGIALAAVIISVCAKRCRLGDSFAMSDPAEYEEVQPRRDPPAVRVEDPRFDSLVPGQPYVVGGDSPAALRAGSGPLVDGDLVSVRSADAYVHGTEPAAHLDDKIVPFSGDEYPAW
jgi:hypothetical protein